MALNHLHLDQDDVPDYGLPNARNRTLSGSGFEGRVAPVDRSNFYGYSTDYRETMADISTARLDHRFSDVASIRSQLRYGRTHVDAVASAPRFVGNVTTLTPQTEALGNQKSRDQTDTIVINQTDLTLAFDTGGLVHTLVAGFEVSRETLHNERRLDDNGPALNLFDPVLVAAPFIRPNGTRVEIETDVASAYVFDNIEIAPRVEVNLGLRYDTVDTRVTSFEATGALAGFVVDLEADDAELSYSASLVYKPVANASVYLAYGTGFETSGRVDIVQAAGGNNNPPTTAALFDVDPELSEAWELGAKYDAMGGRLALAAALFQTDKTNARTRGINPGDPAIVLNGEQRVRGLELSVVGQFTDRWDVFAGYTYLDGEITRSNNPLERGAALDNTPELSLSLWTAYDVTSKLRLGGGVQYVDERTSDVATSATGNIPITAAQLPQDCEVARRLGTEIERALATNLLFQSAALPDGVFPPLFNRYAGGQSFGTHVDNAMRPLPGGGRIRTDLSATLFLSDPATYDGGELVIEDAYGEQRVKPGAGQIALYSATSLHRVEPVTRGLRTASFFWVQSLVADDARRSILFDMDMSIQSLRAEVGDRHAALITLTGAYHNLLRQWAVM